MPDAIDPAADNGDVVDLGKRGAGKVEGFIGWPRDLFVLEIEH
jgi:hypothetical protein